MDQFDLGYWDEYHKYGKSADNSNGSSVVQLAERREKYIREKKEKAFNKLIQCLEERSYYTPDYESLKLGGGKYFPMFIYGQEKRGKPFGDILQNALFFGEAHTTLDNDFHLFQVANDSNQVFAAHGTAEFYKETSFLKSGAKGISGQLMGVTLRDLYMMDYRYQNSILTDRIKIVVEASTLNNVRKIVPAFAYFLRPKVVESFPKAGQNSLQYTKYLQDRHGKFFYS